MALFSRRDQQRNFTPYNPRKKDDELNYTPNPDVQTVNRGNSAERSPFQASGMTQQYARNPQNQSRNIPSRASMNPRPTQPRQEQPQQQMQQRPQAGILRQNFVNQQGDLANQRITQTQQQAQEQADLQRQLFESRFNTLANIGNIQSDAFGQYVDQVRGGLDIQRNTSERQTGEAQRAFDEQRLMNERARSERQRGLQNTLASLGTLQSSAMMNIGSRINEGAQRQDRMAQADLNDRIAAIQDNYRAVENQAEGLIQQEAANYQQRVAALAGQMDQNSIEFRQAVSTIADQANQRINAILDDFDTFNYQTQMQILEAQSAKQGGMSADFLQTGQPVTQADYEWMLNNPDKYAEAFPGAQSARITPQEAQERQTTLSLIEEIANSNLRPISGLYGRTGVGTFAGEGANTRAAINQLLGRLTLDERGKLKGQGQISNFEQQILTDAVSRLNTPGLTEEAIRDELNRLYLLVGGAYANQGFDANTTRPNASQFLED